MYLVTSASIAAAQAAAIAERAANGIPAPHRYPCRRCAFVAESSSDFRAANELGKHIVHAHLSAVLTNNGGR